LESASAHIANLALSPCSKLYLLQPFLGVEHSVMQPVSEHLKLWPATRRQHLLLFVLLAIARAAQPSQANGFLELDYDRTADSNTPRSDEAQKPQNLQTIARDSHLENDEVEDALEDIGLQPAEDEFNPVKGDRHPFWVFNFSKLDNKEAFQCAAVMAAAGILCAAGGIGGGGIYVTVLMVAGGLSVWDAVPLSKSVVFFGSISSLVLNVKKADSDSGTLIDYNVCRLVVPAALIGTYLGVLLNAVLPSWVVLGVLVNILICISYMVLKTTWNQYWEEASVEGQQREESSSSADSELANVKAGQQPISEAGALANPKKSLDTLRNRITATDIGLGVAMLALIIVCSSFRYHAIACQEAGADENQEACHHPATFFVSAASLSAWMSSPSTAAFIKVCCFAGPLLVCCTVLGLATMTLVEKESWPPREAYNFSVMAVCTGCLAGFVGIGGGLIFSPYFLLMGLDPAVAVATSSTCVIFTSSSTTFQYLLTDRIIMSLTLLYGSVNLIASYAGTKLVHCLQDYMGARRSIISGIVSVGVVISTALAFRELASVCFKGSPLEAH